MKALSFDRVSHRVATAVVVAALIAIPTPFTRIPGVLLVLGLLPGLAIASRFPRDAVLGISAALSPVVFGAFVLLALLAGIHVYSAGWAAVLASLGLFVAFGGKTPPWTSSNDRRALILVGVVILLAAFMALALPLSTTWWRWREDSWFHAAVANKLARDGLPLDDPYFAGLRLQYMYFYHAIVAACASLARIDLFRAMILLNGIALASCALAFHALSGFFSRRVAPRVLGLCVWLFAMNGWFYLFYPLRIARAIAGHSHGHELLRQFFPWTPMGHATAMSLIAVEGNQFMFLDKFMVGTAFSLTFGLAASLLFLLLSARRGAWSARHDVAFILCIAGATVLHLVTGITMAVVTALVLAILLMIRAQPSRGGPSYTRLVGCLALGIAVTIPYIHSVLPRTGGDAAVGFAFQRAYALGLLADVLPALVLAFVFLGRAGEHRDTPERLGARPFAELSLSGTGMLLLWTLLMGIVALTVDLTTNNETKFAFLLQLPLAAFAVGAFERFGSTPRSRRIAWLCVASATLPLHMLYFHHAVRDASRIEIGDQEKVVYAWIEAKAPADAVFIEENDVTRVPVLASRDLYWGNETYAHNWGYAQDEMLARRRLRDAMFSEAGPSAEDLERLRSLGRHVFVVYRVHEDDLIDAPERFKDRSDLFHGKFATPQVAVWELRLE